MTSESPEYPAQIDIQAAMLASKVVTNGAAAEVDRCLEELTQLAQTELSPADFYAALLDRATQILPAVGGAVWELRAGSEAQLVSQIDFPPSLIDRQRLVAAANGQDAKTRALSLPAYAKASVNHPCDHPHPWPLIVCSLTADEQTAVVIEVALEKDAPLEVQAGAARLMQVMAEICGDLHRRLELTKLRQRDANLAQFAGLVARLHASLDPVATSYAIANDGRQWIGCDRVSVVGLRHGRATALAVSAVDHVDRRSRQIAALERLAAVIAASGEPLMWMEDGSPELPPELASELQSYLDLGHARQLVAIPLRNSDLTSDPRGRTPLHGMLVAETFAVRPRRESLAQRAGDLARLAGPALGNAFTHHAIPLLPLQSRLANLASVISRRPVAAALAVLVLVTAVVLLAVVPADFNVEVEGSLQPVQRRNLFAPSDGVVEEVLAAHGDRVAKGDALLRIRSPALDLDESRLAGELQTAQARLEAVRSSRSRPQDNAKADDQDRLASEELQLTEQIHGLEKQLEVLKRSRRELSVASPLDGIVLTWNTHQLLASRPVKQGQVLLTVADAAGPWALELEVPDRQAGHVLSELRHAKEQLPVTFLLASDPAVTHRGRLDRLGLATDSSSGKPATEAIVTLDGPLPPTARTGTRVTARIHCGRRSIGYVWLHDVIDFVRTTLLF